MIISQIPIARSTSGEKKPSSFSAMGAGSVQAAPGWCGRDLSLLASTVMEIAGFMAQGWFLLGT